MSLKSGIVAQFRRPTGLLGGLAGRIMASRRSNVVRNEKTVELLDLRPDSRVLELGCGPGLALAACASLVTSGRIVGIDHSDVMIRQAFKRLQRQRTAHKVDLVLGGHERLSDWSEAFDRVFSLNVVQFIDDKSAFYCQAYDVLAPGGRCLTTYQPRLAGDGGEASRQMIETVEAALEAAGFVQIERAEILGGDAPAVCVLATKP